MRLFGRRTPATINISDYPAVIVVRTDGMTVYALPETDRQALADSLCQLAAGFSTALAERQGEL